MKDDYKTIQAAINDIAKRHRGTITPSQVLIAAKDPDSPLHGCFEWDDSAAAEWYRRDQARVLIRSVKIDINYETKTVRTVAYVRDPSRDPNESGYVSVAKVKTDDDQARDVLLAEFKRAGAALERARSLAKVFDLESRMDAFIEELELMRSHVSEERMEQ